MKKSFLIFNSRRIKKWITAPMVLSIFISPSFANAGEKSGKPESPKAEARAVKSGSFRKADRILQLVTGKVTDKDGNPIIGATVVVKGTNNGTATNTDGTFSLDVQKDNAVLVFSFIGYKSQEVSVGNRSTVNVTLAEDAEALKEVLVVGYGTQSRETVTTSITKLDEQVLESVPYANIGSAMQGTLPGVRVQTTSGQPGAAPRIIVRGGTSINNPNGAEPLYVVDGVIRENIEGISPHEIENLQVLKDAASTAIYGARASNGVVIITTKSGTAGRTQINYRYDMTVSKVGEIYDIVNARDYIYYGRLAIQDDINKGRFANPAAARAKLSGPTSLGTGNDLTDKTAYTTQYLVTDPTSDKYNAFKLDQGWERMPDPLDPTKTIIFKDTNYEDVLFQTALSHNHHVSLSGGTDKATFNAGIGYLAGEGTAITTEYNRLTFNLAGNLKLKDNISVNSRVLYSNASRNTVFTEAELFMRSIALPRTAKYQFEDGTLAPGHQRGLGNPAYHLPNRDDEGQTENITLAVGGRWDILPNLYFEPQISLFKNTDNIRSFQPTYFNGVNNLVTTRSASAATATFLNHQADAIFTYFKTFNSVHNLEAKAGFSYFGREVTDLKATGRDASTDNIPTLNASSNFSGVSSSISNRVILGYVARINYDYNQKYLFTANARYDGASNLGANYRWGFFPGVSAGWNVHNESFWGALPENVFSNMKLRASYGVNGNISNIGDFEAQGSYGIPSTVTQQRYNGQIGIQQLVLPNSELQWEESKTVNVGADLGFLNNRITVLVDVYRRVTDNLLTTLSLPASAGFGSIYTNLGSFENKGVELEIGAQVLPSTSSFNWNVSFNAARVKNKVLELPYSGTENNRVLGTQIWDPAAGELVWVPGNSASGASRMEGWPIGNWYGYNALGVYATDAAAAEAPVDMVANANNRKKYAGDVIWEDVNKDGIIDTRDRVYLGNAFPTWTGGFSNTFGYKNFSLYTRLDFTVGHTIYNYARAFINGNWPGEAAPTQEYIDNMWKKEGDVTDIPRYTPYEPSTTMAGWRGHGNYGTSSLYHEKGDFLAIREVTLSYNIPTSLLSKVKVSNLRLNVTGNNLHYFTAYKGLNPEDGGYSGSPSQWGDRGRYPIPRNLIFGANITF